MNRHKTIFLGSVVIITLVVASSLFFYFELWKTNDDSNSGPPFIYPRIFFSNGSISDMVLENDETVHFLIKSTNESCLGATYVKLNLENSSVEMLKAGGDVATYHVLDIALATNNQPIIYRYFTNAFFYLTGSLKILENGLWREYPSLENDPAFMGSISRGPLLNWTFSSDGNLSFAYIYDNGAYFEDWFYTPVFYTETDNTYRFMNSTFPELKNWNYGTHGDFFIGNELQAVLFHRLIDLDHSYPCIIINWGGDSWSLLELGDVNSNITPLLLEPAEEGFIVISYDPGNDDYRSKLIKTTIKNATSIDSNIIKTFEGKTNFYFESVGLFVDDSYVCFFSMKKNEADDYDLYRGIIQDNNFYELQLTNTPQFDEYGAHCELGYDYLHYSWFSTDYNLLENVNEQSCVIYYNRTFLENISIAQISSSTRAYSNFDESKGSISCELICSVYENKKTIVIAINLILVKNKTFFF